ncbi:MAG: hypothetical protein GY829_09700, partial [Gammaproteobacteria bacterium]|nr:hypothetical protein [Gammaproteobacteria bacterium]
SGKLTGTPNGRPNGLASVSPVDVEDDFIVDAIYAGDLYGNLWKFDVEGDQTGNWAVKTTSPSAGSVITPLFQTQGIVTTDGYCESNNNITICKDTVERQPITSRPQIGFHPTYSGYMVYFGTGQYIEADDNLTTLQNTQSFYGVWDNDDDYLTTALDAGDLLEQKIIEEINEDFTVEYDSNGDGFIDGNDTPRTDTYDLRVTSNNSIGWPSHKGWYMDLINQGASNTNNYGERQISNSVLRNGRIIFTTLIPSVNPCESGGTGWLMELDADSGARLEFSPFDLNDDGIFDSVDWVEVTIGGVDILVPTSGKKSKVGIIAAPGIVTSSSGDQEYKYNSGSSGDIEVTTENPGPRAKGRQSWKQLEF